MTACLVLDSLKTLVLYNSMHSVEKLAELILVNFYWPLEGFSPVPPPPFSPKSTHTQESYE